MNRLSHTLALVRSSTLSATPRPTLVHFARAMSQSAAPTQGDKLVLAERQGPVLVLTLNRPKALNALSSPLFEQLNGEFAKAQVDDDVRAVVLTGGEKNFAGESRRRSASRMSRGAAKTARAERRDEDAERSEKQHRAKREYHSERSENPSSERSEMSLPRPPSEAREHTGRKGRPTRRARRRRAREQQRRRHSFERSENTYRVKATPPIQSGGKSPSRASLVVRISMNRDHPSASADLPPSQPEPTSRK